MLRLHGIIGYVSDASIARRLHTLEHRDAVEILYVADADAGRHLRPGLPSALGQVQSGGRQHLNSRRLAEKVRHHVGRTAHGLDRPGPKGSISERGQIQSFASSNFDARAQP
jgi:hypothetical protein